MIGDRMKSLRMENDLTQIELAKQLNLSATAISHYEAGLRTPSSDIIKMYALFFNVSTDYIFELSEFKTHKMDQLRTTEFITDLLSLITDYLAETDDTSKKRSDRI